MTISLENIIPPERVVLLKAVTKDEALQELAAVISRAPEVADGRRLLRAILEREQIMSTGIGLGIAIPHAKIPEVRDFVVGLGKSDAGLEFNSLDGKPVHFVVMIAGPEDQQERYSLVWEYNPVQFVQSRIGVRRYNGIPNIASSNRDEMFAELHVYF